MNCTTARRLMTLSRPGERTDDETAALEKHLAGCSACREEQSIIEATIAGFRQLAGAEPTVPEDHAIVHAVIGQLRVPASSSSPSPFMDAVFRPGLVPGVRVALTACVLLAVTVFGFQASTTLWEMHQLEVRFATHEPSVGARSAWSGDLTAASLSAAQRQSLRSLGYPQPSADQVLAAAGIDRVFQPVLSPETLDAAVRAVFGDTPEARTVLRLLRAHPTTVLHLPGKGE